MKCPECGSDHVDRDEVDIGVGVQCGPWGCFDCGWSESYPIVEYIEVDDPPWPKEDSPAATVKPPFD